MTSGSERSGRTPAVAGMNGAGVEIAASCLLAIVLVAAVLVAIWAAYVIGRWPLWIGAALLGLVWCLPSQGNISREDAGKRAPCDFINRKEPP